jgi:hypothetical protein
MIEEVDGELIAKPMHGGANVISTLFRSNYFTVLPPNTMVKKGNKLKFTALSPLSIIPHLAVTMQQSRQHLNKVL